MHCKARPIVCPVYIINRHDLWVHDSAVLNNVLKYVFSFYKKWNKFLVLKKNMTLPVSAMIQPKQRTLCEGDNYNVRISQNRYNEPCIACKLWWCESLVSTKMMTWFRLEELIDAVEYVFRERQKGKLW